MAVIRFAQRHRTLWHLVVRGPLHAWVSRRIWRALDTPEFRADLARSTADFAAGRSFRMVGREFIPSDSWRPDDEQQPNGWHHDGERWVRS